MSSSARLNYIDNLRVFCMLFGILVQTNRLAEQEPWLIFVDVSHFFRMAAFFVVSGYFAAMLYQRRKAARFFRHRAVAILVPLTFGLLVINPITICLIAAFHDPTAPGLGYFEALSGLWGERRGPGGPGSQVLHLWFLFALALYVALMPAIAFGIERLSPLINRLKSNRTIPIRLVLTLVVVFLVLVARTFDEALARIFGENAVVEETLIFTPYFVLGAFGYHYQEIWQRLHRIDIPTILVAVAFMGVHHVFFADVLSPVSTMVRIAADAATTMASIYFLLWFFKRWLDFETSLTRFLSEGIYTVYILQILLIYLFGKALAFFGVPEENMFWPVVILTFAVGYSAYHFAVARSLVLSLLLRGRLTEPRSKTRSRSCA